MSENHRSLADFIWSVADLLRGDFKQAQYDRSSCSGGSSRPRGSRVLNWQPPKAEGVETENRMETV